MPPLISLFNFITGFEHVDESFQNFDGIYPGDESCRETVPHAKWHELSAGALLDMVYLADCVAAVATGADDAGCAHMSSLTDLGEITRSQISSWIDANIQTPNIPIVKDVVPLFIEEMFLVFDVNNDDKIDWTDISSIVDTAEDVVQGIIDMIEDFVSRFQNFCVADSDCSDDEFCNFLQFGCRPKQENGFIPCIKDSQCYSGRCTDFWHKCEAKLPNGSVCTAGKACESDTCAVTAGAPLCGDRCSSNSDCDSNSWCHTAYSPNICRPKKDKNYFPCIADSQCKSGRCSDVFRYCR